MIAQEIIESFIIILISALENICKTPAVGNTSTEGARPAGPFSRALAFFDSINQYKTELIFY
jgi:hypothetical protein